MEPKLLSDQKFQYTKPSDIYSFGVLMWEISSGKVPFEDYDNNALLSIDITKGKRETTTPDTPKEYENLYKNCWKQEPEQRPTIGNVLSELKKMNELKSEGMCNMFIYFIEIYLVVLLSYIKLIIDDKI
jgi:serine/threonine protein kinase